MNSLLVAETKNSDFGALILKYLEIFKVSYSSSSVYLANLVFQSITVVFRVWIFTQLYKVTYSVAHSTDIGGLTIPMAVWSLTLVQGFQTATQPSLIRMIEEEVKSGSLAYSINRPYSYLLFHYFGFLGRTLPKLVTNLIIGAIATVILVGFIQFTWMGLLLGVLLVFFGYTLDFAMQFIIGLSSFWVEDTSAFRWIYSKMFLIFGGAIVPLSLFPDAVRNIGELSPFAQLYYGASRIIVNFDSTLFERFFIAQLFWVALFMLIASFMFKKGVKNVSINGG